MYAPSVDPQQSQIGYIYLGLTSGLHSVLAPSFLWVYYSLYLLCTAPQPSQCITPCLVFCKLFQIGKSFPNYAELVTWGHKRLYDNSKEQ
jgi:hypothetical protein